MLGSVDFGETAVVADMEAGVGTLTRLSDSDVDTVLVIVEPTPKSLEVGARAAELARLRRAGRIVIVANRVRGDDDLGRVRDAFPDHEVTAVPDDPAIVQAERTGVAPLDLAPQAPAVQALVELATDVAVNRPEPTTARS